MYVYVVYVCVYMVCVCGICMWCLCVCVCARAHVLVRWRNHHLYLLVVVETQLGEYPGGHSTIETAESVTVWSPDLFCRESPFRFPHELLAV